MPATFNAVMAGFQRRLEVERDQAVFAGWSRLWLENQMMHDKRLHGPAHYLDQLTAPPPRRQSGAELIARLKAMAEDGAPITITEGD